LAQMIWFVNRSRYKTSYYELQYFRLSEQHAAGRVGHDPGGKVRRGDLVVPLSYEKVKGLTEGLRQPKFR
jgi:hypothetical protein